MTINQAIKDYKASNNIDKLVINVTEVLTKCDDETFQNISTWVNFGGEIDAIEEYRKVVGNINVTRREFILLVVARCIYKITGEGIEEDKLIKVLYRNMHRGNIKMCECEKGQWSTSMYCRHKIYYNYKYFYV